MNKLLRKFIFGEDEEPGKIYIVTPNGRMKFKANLNTREDFERALNLIKEESNIMFDNGSRSAQDGSR